MRIIAGTARSRIIEAPPGKDTRPTLDRVRENLFNMLQTGIVNSKVLDLFAGSGALSLEAISRGASFAVMCDHDRAANRVEKSNSEKLSFSGKVRIMLCDWSSAVHTLKNESSCFDIIFLDPPYAMTDLRDVLQAVEDILDDDGIVVLEHEAKVVPIIPDNYVVVKERSWGYCGVSFCKKRIRNEKGREDK